MICQLSAKKFEAAIFDLDGVITQSEKAHAAAWKEMFDLYLSKYGKRLGKHYDPFDIGRDYAAYVDGKLRYEGVKSFLESRGIHLPYGSSEDAPKKETVCGLGNWKNQLFQKHLKREGVEVYASSVALIRELREMGFKIAVVSSSKNCSEIVKRTKIGYLFDVQVDGIMAEKLKFKGKPDPDVFLYTAKKLRVSPEKTVVFEDSFAGVNAGHKGHFGCVIGIDRRGHAKDLKQHGADIVLADLRELQLEKKS